MKRFSYRAYDQSGILRRGELEADDREAALSLLRDRALWPVLVGEKVEPQTIAFLTRRHPSPEDIEHLTSELALLLENGVKLDKGLEILRGSVDSAPLRRLLGEIYRDVRAGQSLTSALGRHPRSFDPLYLNLVELGESSGDLKGVFRRLAEDLNFQGQLRRQISQSLAYPAFIFGVCILSILFVFNFIVPQMSGLFASSDGLPSYTIALLALSDFVQAYQLWALPVLVGAGLTLRGLWRRPALRERFETFALRLPLLRTFLLQAEQVRFSAAVGMMLGSGIPIDRALRLGEGNIKNRVLRRSIVNANRIVSTGGRLSEALANSPLFPTFFQSLLEVGEESGELFPVFEEIKKRARIQFEGAVKRFLTLLEPSLIVFMGVVVGGVVVVMLLSIIAVNDVAL